MEENFDQLRRLLVLKRYEAPPPGFFANFSGKVMARIEAAELAVAPAWWQRLGFDFNCKPALVCGLGVVVCGLLSAGVLASVVETANQPVAGLSMEAPVAFGASPFGQMYAADAVPRSTEPVFSARRFDQFGLRAQPVSFQFGK
jgi:hypothetical protein